MPKIRNVQNIESTNTEPYNNKQKILDIISIIQNTNNIQYKIHYKTYNIQQFEKKKKKSKNKRSL